MTRMKANESITMARRRKNEESLLAILFMAPWWISIVVGAVIFVVLKWIAPSVSGSSLILKPITAALSSVAWVISGVFLVVGAMSFARQKVSAFRAILSQTPTAAWNPRAISGRKEPSSSRLPRGAQPGPGEDPIWEAWKANHVAAAPPPTEWSIELLRNIEWKRFEDVCQKFYQMKGFRSETTPLGPDGGIDIRLYSNDSGIPTSIVQCKAWGDKYVGVKPVRELLGVMTHEKIAKGFFMASGEFSDDAKQFAQTNPITLITGEMLVFMIKRLSEPDQQALLAFAIEGDYTTPTCPMCGIKMKVVQGTGGRPDFWGCHNYPRCRQKLGMRAANKS